MPREYTVADELGREVTFDWDLDTEPTDADFEEIFAASADFTPEPAAQPLSTPPILPETMPASTTAADVNIAALQEEERKKNEALTLQKEEEFKAEREFVPQPIPLDVGRGTTRVSTEIQPPKEEPVPQIGIQGPSRPPTASEQERAAMGVEAQQLESAPAFSKTNVSAIMEGISNKLTFGFMESPEAEIARKAKPIAFNMAKMATAIGETILFAGPIKSAVNAIPMLSKHAFLANVTARALTSLPVAAPENIAAAVENKQTWTDAFLNTAQTAAGAGISAFPELAKGFSLPGIGVKVPWQAVQAIGQPLTDLAFDLTADSMRGRDVTSKDWWTQELPSLGLSAGFAIVDIKNGEKFVASQDLLRKDAKSIMNKAFSFINKSKGNVEVTPLKAAPETPDITPAKVPDIAPEPKQVTFGPKTIDPKEVDTLTKLPNNAVTKRAVAEVPEDHFTASIDGDNFKAVNDVFGHAEGDKVLTRLGELMNKHFPEEFRGREGGEEFFVDFGTKFDDVTLERVKKFHADVVDNVKVGPNNEPFTLSIGVGKGKYKSATGRLELNSDHASYLAKDGGRNQIAVDKDGEIEYHIGSDPGKKEYLLTYSRKQVESAIDVLKKGGEIEPGKAEAIKGEIRKPKEKPPVSRPEVPAEPPKPEVKPTEKVVGLNKREGEYIRAAIGATKLSDAQKKTHKATFEQAKVEKTDDKALEVADHVLKSNRQMTDVEHVGAVLKVGKLLDEYNDRAQTISKLIEEGNTIRAREEAITQEIVADQIDRITLSTRNARRETARALSIGRLKVKSLTYDLASVTQRARANKGKRLSAKEQAAYEKLSKEHEILQKQHEELNKKYDEETAKQEKLLAQRTVKKLLKRRTAPIEKIMAERKDIEKQLTDIGFRLNDITGLTSEGSYLIGKLAVNYIKEAHAEVKGKVEMADIVKRVKEKVPDISEQEIYRALNEKNPKRVIKARSEAQKQVARLKSIAKLHTKIDDAAKGVFDPKRKRPPTDFEIKNLRNQLKEMRNEAYESGIKADKLESVVRTINELQDMLTNQYRAVKKKQKLTDPELAAARQKANDLRQMMKIEDEIATIDEQIRNNDFKPTEKPEPRQLPKELENAKIRLSLKRKQISKKIAASKPITAKEVFGQIAGTPRTLMTIGEISGWLRQNVVPVVSHPIRAAQVAPTSLKATFSEKQFEKMDLAIKESENFYIYEKSGLELRELDGKASSREEAFRSNWLEKVPILGAIVRGSERSMVSIGNLIRTTLFDDFLVKNPNATHDELKAYADFLNKATGIGDLGQFKGAADVLSTTIFSPKFTVSRFQTPTAIIKHWKHKRVRKQIARDMAGFVGTGATVLGLAALALKDEPDAEVGDDPRRADWGKIRIGNQRWDIWGGFQQPARLIWRTMVWGSDKAGVTGKEISEDRKEFDPIDMFWRFATFKLSPAITLPVELITGETAVGEKVTPGESVARHSISLFLQDIAESYKDRGLKNAILTGATTGVGVGVSTYSSAYKRVLQVNREYNALKRENPEAAEKFLEKNERAIGFASNAKKIDKGIKELEKARNQAEKVKDKDEVKRLDEKINEITKSFEKTFNKR